MVGYGFMGAAHSHAWRSVGPIFGGALTPELVVICGRTRDGVAAAADHYGFAEWATDWRDVVARDDVDVVDVVTPGDSHCAIAVAALQAGKHVLCEKPLANTVAEAEVMVKEARDANAKGIRSMVGFNYRRVPALTLAHDLVAAGELGRIYHVRAVYLQDWIMDPEFPLVWRLRREDAGSGALGDLGAHVVDLAQFITGEPITGVSALTETFIKERPLTSAHVGLAGATASGSASGPVTVDDTALFLARLAGGGVATFEATRFAAGRKNGLRIEINGERGTLEFGLESLNELLFYERPDPGDEHAQAAAGFRRILVTEPVHPYVSAWWPAGHILGWEHSHTNQIHDFVEAIAKGEEPKPSFEDGLSVQRVLDAVQRSADAGSGWIGVGNGSSLDRAAERELPINT
jgi:predicted dehydrogenase